jgi:hypothetical protein
MIGFYFIKNSFVKTFVSVVVKMQTGPGSSAFEILLVHGN